MKRCIGEIAKDLKNAFVFTDSYVNRDSSDIRQHIEGSMAETNCKRILAMIPIFLVIDIIQVAMLFGVRHHETFGFSMTVSLLLIVQALFYAVLLVWGLYIKKVVRTEKCWKCNLTYRSFWCIWMFGTVCIAYCNMASGLGGGTYIFFCIVVCLVPLYPVKDWVISLILFVGMVMVAAARMDGELRFFFYNCIIMLVMGFIAQRFEMGVWMQREYIYATAFFDPLTGLLNRRGGNAYLAEEMEYRIDSRIGVIMLDVDYFKKYNDALGHDEGDNCLKMVSASIREAVGERTKLIVRHGGEEFVIILFDATEEETKEWAEKIREKVYDKALPAPYRQVADVVTVSVGATIMAIRQDSLYEQTLKAADKALYIAKESGRNQVVFRC